jgi:hypothetical protein
LPPGWKPGSPAGRMPTLLTLCQRTACLSTTFKRHITMVAAKLIVRITEKFRSEAQGQYIAKRTLYFRNTRRDAALVTTETIQQFEAQWKVLNSRMEIVPGKEALAAFREYVHVEYGITLTDYRIISEFKREEVPDDMKRLISDLDVFRSGAATLIS